ncbi:MAG: ribonuclease Z [Bacteroidales bacterium]|nr:ribonuclease Z [Bacteroidales bacterium]
MTFKVTILGSNSAIPTIKRNPTSQLVNHNERLFLIDCAEGTQLQLRKYRIRMQRIGHIFISHLHGDHFFGLIGLISSMHLLGRKKELHIYGPGPLENILKVQLEASQTELVYPLHFHPIKEGSSELIYENDRLEVVTIPLNHRIPTSGFLFREKTSKRKLIKDVVKNMDIPSDMFAKIKDGADFTDASGKLYKNEEMTTAPPKSRSYAYCSDTSYFEPVIPIIYKTDLLYHEATFMQDRADAAAEKFHATTVEAATIAKKSEVNKLIIGHFSTRYDDEEPLLKEAREVFQNTDIATEGKSFSI